MDETSCPVLSNCKKSSDDSNYFSCVCGEQFITKKKNFMRTEENSYKYIIERCEGLK
jgi:hypothetical protein